VPSNTNTKRDTSTAPKGENGVNDLQNKDKPKHIAQDAEAPGNDLPAERPEEYGGQAGPEPTRYGDWEKKGRCTDF